MKSIICLAGQSRSNDLAVAGVRQIDRRRERERDGESSDDSQSVKRPKLHGSFEYGLETSRDNIVRDPDDRVAVRFGGVN